MSVADVSRAAVHSKTVRDVDTRPRRARVVLALLLGWLCARPRAARAEDAPPPASWPALGAPLQDNSFLIEEAYNQERGVVQHIIDAKWDRKSGEWDFFYTQEWPVPDQTNQLSFTVP